MNTVRLRPRRNRAARAREIQGLLAIPAPTPETAPSETSELTRPTAPRAARAKLAEPRPLPYRAVLASWPDDWRERWGRLANALEDRGLSWRDAEGRAFLETWNQWKANAEVVERN